MPACPVQLALALCLSVPGLGTELPDGIISQTWVTNDLTWDWGALHDRYRRERKLWSLERQFGDVTAGMVLGDTRNVTRLFERERTLYLYSNYNDFSFLVTPESVGLAYRWQFE